jgi:dTDP-4-dehydrorhamnose 3,5-epimerase
VIHDVRVTPLKQIVDERGKVMHMVRRDMPGFSGFGEIYFSTINAGAVKAWHRHKLMTQNYAVPFGTIHLVLFDARHDSRTRGSLQALTIGEENYSLVTIPPMVWYGFTTPKPPFAIVANCASLPHDPAEVERLDPGSPDIPFRWETIRP